MRWLALAVYLLMCEAAGAVTDIAPLHVLMEKPMLRGGWIRSGKAEFFDKDTLFDLVDGEAEAYFPYGIQEAASAIYVQDRDKNREVRVEVYQMRSLLDAYGIYSMMREVGSKRFDVGADGFNGTTQVMFYVDRYFVKVQGYSADAEAALLDLAKVIAGRLSADTKKPAELALVAIPHVVPQSDQYIGQSVLGYAFWPRGMIATIDVNGSPARVFVVMTDSSVAASVALKKYLREIANDGGKVHSVVDGKENLYLVDDPMQAGVAVSQAGRYVIGAANLKELDKQGIPLVRQVRRHVTSLAQ